MQNDQKKLKYEGPFISDIIKTIFGRKILLAIIWVVVTIVGILTIQFVLNPSITKYEVEFRFNYNRLNEGYNYDGSVFNYLTVISKENLEKVKDSKSEYEKIDIDKILDKSYISIEEVLDDNGDFSIFVIKASIKAFPNDKVARNFLNDLINITNEKNLNMATALNYSSNIDAIYDSFYYEMKLDFLKKQYEVIDEVYNKLISSFGNYMFDDKTLLEYKDMVSNYLYQNPVTSLLTETAKNGFVDDFENNKNRIINDLNGKIYDYKLNINKLESLKALLDSSTVEYNAISEVRDLIFKNEEIKYDINNYTQKLLANNVSVLELKNIIPEINQIYSDDELNSMVISYDEARFEEFKKKTNQSILKIKEFTDKLNLIESTVLEEELIANYVNLSIVKEKGGINIVLVIIISLLLGFAVGATVNIVLDYNKIFVPKKDEEKLN